MRFALYARYSSDLQSAASIADQLRLCREAAAQRGGEIVAEFSDAAISGANAVNRPGLQALLEGARAGRFDAVIAEALDRISRDQEDVAAIFKRLRHRGVAIVTLAEGEVSSLHVGLKGTMNAMFLEDLAAKTRRGQRGRVEAGFAAGGLSYGYRMVREIGADGEIVRGRRAIDDGQAAVVRRIFADYVAGVSPRAVAAALNRAGVPGPRGGRWNASTINGNRQRGNGILHNALYAGRLVFNRQRFAKDPDSGRRGARLNPAGQWVTVEVPALRIVDQETWEKAQALKAGLARAAGAAADGRAAGEPTEPRAPWRARRPKRLLSGLVRCGVCGGAYTVAGPDRMICQVHRESGACSNGRSIRITALEARVLAGLRERLLAPEMFAAFAADYRAAATQRSAGLAQQQSAAERQLRETTAQIERLVDAIAAGADALPLRERLAALERRRETLAAEAAAAGQAARDAPATLHPNLPEIYRRKVAALEQALQADAGTRAEAAQALRALIERVVLRPGTKRGEMTIELHGQLAGLLALSRAQNGPGTDVMLKMVAGRGLVQYDTDLPLFVTL